MADTKAENERVSAALNVSVLNVLKSSMNFGRYRTESNHVAIISNGVIELRRYGKEMVFVMIVLLVLPLHEVLIQQKGLPSRGVKVWLTRNFAVIASLVSANESVPLLAV